MTLVRENFEMLRKGMFSNFFACNFIFQRYNELLQRMTLSLIIALSINILKKIRVKRILRYCILILAPSFRVCICNIQINSLFPIGNYIYDFKRTQRKTIANRDDRIVLGVNLTLCAKLCVEEESFNCASFDYCNTSECRLSTANMKNIGQVSYTQSLTCDIYNRKFPYLYNKHKHTRLTHCLPYCVINSLVTLL